MKRGNYFEKMSPKRKYLIGRNLVIVGVCGVFLPIIPGLLSLSIGIFLLFPKTYEQVKNVVLGRKKGFDEN
jgi:UPF0716 family protein affecting phage T7 exclusion